MQPIYRTELKRAIINPRFILVFILAAISFAYGFFQIHPMQSQSPVGAVTAWEEILYAGYYGFFAAALAALPFADSLSRDKNHHLMDTMLIRSSYKQYLRAKTLATMLSGAIAVALPAILMLAICACIYPAGPVHRMDLYFNGTEIYSPTQINPGFYLNPSIGMYTALIVLFLLAFGAAYALLGMGVSFLTRKADIALSVPIICYSFGYYFIPTSRHLNWMVSTRALLAPQGNLFSPLLQSGLIVLFFLIARHCFGKKENQVLQ
jgi:hypothetical protein